MKKLKLALMIVMSTTFLFGCSSNKTEAKKNIELGKQAVEENKYKEAEDSFELAANEDPNNEEAKSLNKLMSDLKEANNAFDNLDLDKATEHLESLKSNKNINLMKKDIENLSNKLSSEKKLFENIDNINLDNLMDKDKIKTIESLVKKVNKQDLSKELLSKLNTLEEIRKNMNSTINLNNIQQEMKNDSQKLGNKLHKNLQDTLSGIINIVHSNVKDSSKKISNDIHKQTQENIDHIEKNIHNNIKESIENINKDIHKKVNEDISNVATNIHNKVKEDINDVHEKVHNNVVEDINNSTGKIHEKITENLKNIKNLQDFLNHINKNNNVN